MTGVLSTITVVILGLAACLTLLRIWRGPSVLDRVAAVDNIVAVLVCGLGLHVATGHHETLTLLVTTAVVGFLSSVAVARFLPRTYRRTENAPAYRSARGERP